VTGADDSRSRHHQTAGLIMRLEAQHTTPGKLWLIQFVGLSNISLVIAFLFLKT